MVRHLQECWADEKGQDLIEYALLCALVATGTGILLPRAMIGTFSQIYSRVNSVLIRFGNGGG